VHRKLVNSDKYLQFIHSFGLEDRHIRNLNSSAPLGSRRCVVSAALCSLFLVASLKTAAMPLCYKPEESVRAFKNDGITSALHSDTFLVAKPLSK
jgi:hypothetical protein